MTVQAHELMGPGHGGPGPSRPGQDGTRRRGGDLLSAIYAAVLDELAEVGYQAMTIEGVAKRAHTGKAAIYRRWADKVELVSCTLDALLPRLDELPDTGDVRDDLLVIFRTMVAFFNSPTGAALQRIFADTARACPMFGDGSGVEDGPPSLREIKERVVARRTEMLYALLRRGVERGEVRPGAVCQRVVDTGPALLMTRCLVAGGAVTDEDVVEIVDDVLVPLIRA